MLPPLCCIPALPRRRSTRRRVHGSVACVSSINGQHATTTRLPHWKLTTTMSPMLPPTTMTPIAPPTTQQFTPTTVLRPRAHNEIVASPPHTRAHRPPPAPCGRLSRHEFFALVAHSFYPHAAWRHRPQYQPRRYSPAPSTGSTGCTSASAHAQHYPHTTNPASSHIPTCETTANPTAILSPGVHRA